jgi:glycosyltransferase involved in cell wall biosynthesis
MTPRVLFLNPWDRFIGPNRYLLEMLRHTPDLAKHATVVFHKKNDAAEEYDSLGCKVVICPDVDQIRAQFRMGNLFRFVEHHTIGVQRVIKLIRSVGPDLIVSNTEQLLVGGISSRLLRIPHIKMFHAMSFAYRLKNRPTLMRTYLGVFSMESDRVVAVSETLKRALVSGGIKESKLTAIPNPLAIQDLRTAAERKLPADLETPIGEHGPIIVSAGVIFPRKGQDQLIEALPAIRERFPKTLCVFAGGVGDSSGLENTNGFYKMLRDRVQRFELNDHVLFLGEIDYLPSLLHRADLYVQTSRTESFGRVVGESLVCGTPVVSFDVGACGEVAGPGAILVKPGDTHALASAIMHLIEHADQKRKLVEEGRKHVEECYEGSIVAERFSQLLIAEASKGRWPS